MDTTPVCDRCLEPWVINVGSGELTCFIHGRPDGSTLEQQIWDSFLEKKDN